MPAPRRTAALAVAAALALTAATACSGSDDPESAGSSSSPSTTSTTAPSPGCSGTASSVDPGEVVRSINSGGTQRGYRLAVPADADGTDPQPLVLSFHGSGSNALEQSAYSGLSAAGVERGMVVATPDAIANNWQLSAATDLQNPDIRLARDIIEEVSAEVCVDERRIFAAGLSLGAAFSSLLACALPDEIAAIGLVTVEVLVGPCPDGVPVLAFHGTADAVVPYGGGEVRTSARQGQRVQGTTENMRKWAELNGCRERPETSEVGSQVTRAIYPDCDGDAEVELYTIDGGGHTWPGSPIDVASLGLNTDEVDATDLILDFFEEHPLPER